MSNKFLLIGTILIAGTSAFIAYTDNDNSPSKLISLSEKEILEPSVKSRPDTINDVDHNYSPNSEEQHVNLKQENVSDINVEAFENREQWRLTSGFRFTQEELAEYQTYDDETLADLINQDQDKKAMNVYLERFIQAHGYTDDTLKLMENFTARGFLGALNHLIVSRKVDIREFLEENDPNDSFTKYQTLLNQYVGSVFLSDTLGNMFAILRGDDGLHELNINSNDVNITAAKQFAADWLKHIQAERAQQGLPPLQDLRSDNLRDYEESMFERYEKHRLKYDFWWD
ncbi:MAG: hypothetical protein AAGB12_15505 [Pseudomonadota bacterium]